MVAATRFLAAGALLAALLAACDESDEEKPYAPDNCEHVEPDTGVLIAKVTVDARHPAVPVFVYRGEYENAVLAAADTATASKVAFELASDESYAVTALYTSGPDTILVLGGASLDVKKDEYRDADCYSVPDREVDLRLKL